MKQFKKSFWRHLNIFLLWLQVKTTAHDWRIVLGAGGTFHKGWIHTDIETLNILVESDWERYFKKSSIRALLAEHVWEHLSGEEGVLAARNCFEFLRHDGYLRLAVPDGFNPDPAYIEYVKVGGSGVGADDHKILYDYISLSKMLNSVGFEVKLLEYFDQMGIFHSVEWASSEGKIERSSVHDSRNAGGELKYTSLIVDAQKT